MVQLRTFLGIYCMCGGVLLFSCSCSVQGCSIKILTLFRFCVCHLFWINSTGTHSPCSCHSCQVSQEIINAFHASVIKYSGRRRAYMQLFYYIVAYWSIICVTEYLRCTLCTQKHKQSNSKTVLSYRMLNKSP